MPTYEYECPSGHRYETREGFDAPATQKCIKCRKIARRVLFAPPVVFKGSGFYVTDSRKAESAGASGSGSDSTKSETPDTPDSSSNGASETKAETTSDKQPTSSGSTPAKADKAPPKADKAKASS